MKISRRTRSEPTRVLDGAGNYCSLTPSLADRLVDEAGKGRWPAAAAIACGVHPNTLSRWLVKGAEIDSVEPYQSFCQTFLEAEQEYTRRLEDVLSNAALGISNYGGEAPDVKVAQYLLERRRPELWNGAGISAMGIVMQAAESRPLRVSTMDFLQSLPEEVKKQARAAGFQIPHKSTKAIEAIGQETDEQED